MTTPLEPTARFDREDLETILALTEMLPQDENVRRLRLKVQESMKFHRWQDSIIETARLKEEERRRRCP